MRKRSLFRGFLGLLILGAGHLPVFAGDSVYGTVVAVKTAELVRFNYGAGEYDVHLAGIVVPQAQADEAKKFVINLVRGKNVRVRLVRRAGYEMVAQLLTDDPVAGIQDVAVVLLDRSLAKTLLGSDSRFRYKYGELKDAEARAKAARPLRGVWARDRVIP
jgi:endonuclease YncB( thermonuclease family)